MPTVTIRRTWKVEGVLTDVESALLSDPTGTYGVKRNDTDAVVVADGTEMDHPATGIYEYAFDATAGLSYTGYVEFVYGGATYHLEHDIPTVGTPGEPIVSILEVREHVVADGDEDDDMLARLVSAATHLVEAHTARQFVDAGRVLGLDCFPQVIELRVCPVQSVESIKYYDLDGVQQTLDDEAYLVDVASEPGRIVPAVGTSWPATQRRPNAVEVAFTAGYGETRDTVPDAAKQAALLLVGSWYANREAIGTVTSEIALAYRALVNSLKWTW